MSAACRCPCQRPAEQHAIFVRRRHRRVWPEICGGNLKKGNHMSIEEFKEYVKGRCPLDTEEIHRFMDEMSDRARRVTFRLNTAYHTPDEVRGLLSELFGYEVPESLRLFPPFYTDFGGNITVGEDVFINACCHFQTTAASSSGTAAKSDTMWCLPRSTTDCRPKRAGIPFPPLSFSGKMSG